MVLLAGAAATWGYLQFRGISRADVDLAAGETFEPTNFLIVGSDTRDLDVEVDGGRSKETPDGQRADTILIARADPELGAVEMLTIPRDLWISDGKGGHRRINSAYSDGPQGLIDAIDESLGIPVHHYLEVNFESFQGLVDALGGIGMYFDHPVYDERSGLNIKKKGCYTLDGSQALAFARSRYLNYSNGVKWIADPTGDLGRATRQQVFLRRALSKVSSLGLNNVGSIKVLVTLARDYLTIDDDMGLREMMDLMGRFSEFDPSSMAIHRLATDSVREGNALVEQLNERKSQPVIDVFTGAAPMQTPEQLALAAVKPENVLVDVLNGTDTPGLAKQGAGALEQLDFGIGNIADGEAVTETAIAYAEGYEKEALLVASKIQPTPTLEVDSTLTDGRVVLTLAGTLTVPGVNAPATTVPTGVMGAGSTPTTASSAGAATSSAGRGDAGATTAVAAVDGDSGGSGAAAIVDEVIGLQIGDPPAGITCDP